MHRVVFSAGSQKGFGLVAAAILIASASAAIQPEALRAALDAQDRGALDKLSAEAAAAADKQPNDVRAQYLSALAHSTMAQLAVETGDKALGRTAAEAGIRAAQRAVALQPNDAENHRILGTLCGQVIPSNVLAGLKWGQCAMDEVKKAVEMNPKSALAWLSHGVGNYYLPAAFGGGTEKAIADMQKALQLDPKLADAHLWLGVALRKAGRNAEARKSLERSLELNPRRKWAAQQLAKTPVR